MFSVRLRLINVSWPGDRPRPGPWGFLTPKGACPAVNTETERGCWPEKVALDIYNHWRKIGYWEVEIVPIKTN